MVANGYRTVEFISNNECGVNGCGEKIYCLPANGHIKVELIAAELDGCINCNARAPFTDCFSAHCQDPIASIFYPKAAAPLDGVVDVAMNSLDGDRGGDAEGPAAFYNETAAAGNGDNFVWSFFVTDQIDLSSPAISSIVPNHKESDVSLSEPLRANFDKVMMAGSLSTGSILINNGKTDVEHKLINLWNFADQPTGYWINAENTDEAPPDPEPDWTAALIKHSFFYDAVSYRVQVGSGVKNIYQNCFKPSAGVTCGADAVNPSCCCMTPTAAAGCPAAACP
jgi:hypothetical protein